MLSGSPRRSGENIDHARALAESEDELPPIIVHRQTMRVIDGMHRLRAASLRGEAEIMVRYFDGDESSSYVLAVKANIAHGLPLSLADRKAAAGHIIGLYPHWSDRAIAAVAGLASKTVGVIRKNTLQEDQPRSGEEYQELGDARIGQDGRVRPRNSSQRREIAAKLISENPDASLREIARKAGISPETVRRVRAQLSNDQLLSPPSNKGRREPRALASDNESLGHTPGRVAPRQLDQARRLQSLREDPAFRSTEVGRYLLQMLSVSQRLDGDAQAFAANIPAHCVVRLCHAARACARAWSDFADKIERLDIPAS
jgi:transposase-like protein